MRYVAGFVIGVLLALVTFVTFSYLNDVRASDGGVVMVLTFLVFPLQAFVLGFSGIVVAFLTRKIAFRR